MPEPATTVEIIVPIVHLNGTSRDELKEQLCKAYRDIGTAINSLCMAGPNGRDYYHSPGLLAKAQAQHGRRIKILRDLQSELISIVEGIDEQE